MTCNQLLAAAGQRSSRAHLYQFYSYLLDLLALPRLSDRSTVYTLPYASLKFPSPIIPTSQEGGLLDDGSKNVPTAHTTTAGTVDGSRNAKELTRMCLELAGQAFLTTSTSS